MLGPVRQIGRYLVVHILSVQEAGYVRDVSQSNVPGMRRGSRRSPVQGSGNADVCITFISSEPGEGAEIFRFVVKLIAECLAKQNVAFNLSHQHEDTSGHGWAISDRRPKSTLA
jgi:hypothetical protein